MNTSLFKEHGQYIITGKLWIEYNGNKCFGPGRMELLERIEHTGSINKAAKEMGMSYKKAWMMIDSLNEQMSEDIVVPQAGGENGGGTSLSDAGKKLMQYHEAMQNRFKKFIEEEELIRKKY